MLNVMKLAMLMLGLLVVGGCKSYDTAPSAGLGDPYPAPINDPQITVLAPDLREVLGFQPAFIIDDGERPLHVEVPVRNLTTEPYQIEYRFLFFNEDGRELTPTMGWQHQPLDGKKLARLKGSALSKNATAYRLEVRWSR